MQEILPILLGVLAAVFLVYAIVTRKRLTEAEALLADTRIRFESIQNQSKKAQDHDKSNRDQGEKLRQQIMKLEKQVEDGKQRLNEKNLDAIRLKTETDSLVQKTERQKDHLLEQVQVITAQLSEAVKEKKAALDELARAQTDLETRVRLQGDTHRQQINEWQGKLQQANRERQNLQTQFEKFKAESGHVKPEELKRWQLKVARTEQLYTSMKGLREMAEERNRNWETALRIFAAHVLGKPVTEGGIGLLVGEALEKIGATLVIDDEEETPRKASSAELPADGREALS